jgi:hypothetical protein
MSIAELDAWRVVETQHSETDQITRSIPHTRIGATPMSEQAARAYATVETARHLGGRLRRTFHAEPNTGGKP